MSKTIPASTATMCAVTSALALLVTSMSVRAQPAYAASTTYTHTDLGVLSDVGPVQGNTIARGVNTSGQVVGHSLQRQGDGRLQLRAFYWDGNSMLPLDTLGGPTGAARGINDSGQIVGFARTSSTDTQQEAFVTEKGTDGTTQLVGLGALPGLPSSEAFAINESGQIVGRSSMLPSSGPIRSGRAFLYGDGVMDDLGALPNGSLPDDPYSEAWAINDRGQVVGESGSDEDHGRAFLYSGGNMKALGTLQDCPYSEAFGIDNSGQIVGWSYTSRASVQGRAFLYRDGEMKDLGTLPGDTYSMARAIDEHGRVVGQSRDASGQNRAFLWENGRMTDLNSLFTRSVVPPGDPPLKRLLDAYAISESGQIVGSALNTNDKVRAFLLTPNDTTSPNTMATVSPEPNAAGWNNEDVTVTLDTTDEGGSNVKEVSYSINGDVNTVHGDRATFDITTEGENTITYSATDHAGNTEVAESLTVRIDKSEPEFSCDQPDDAWHADDVTLDCTASDGGSGLADSANGDFSLSTNVADGEETDNASTDSKVLTDTVGNSVTAGPIGGNKIDKKAPTTIASSGSYDGGDWTNQSVTVTLEASDGGSGVQGSEYDLDDAGYLVYRAGGISVSSEGRHTISYRSTDMVGNVESPARNLSVNIDKTDPRITGSRTPAPNADGWNNSDVTMHFTCADTLSGLASVCPADVVLGEGAEQSVTRSVSDEAGNSASATVGDINVDKSAPTVNLTGIAPGATYILGSVPEAKCSTTDVLSGVARQATLHVTGGPLGSVTATCGGASDRAGNTASMSVAYSVIYDFDGFFNPVDNPDVLNRVKAGSAIPVKFSLGGDQGLDIFARTEEEPSFPRSGPMACDSSDPVDAVEQTMSANSSGLTYDASTDLYTYVWKTHRNWTGCRQLVVSLADGKEYRANFKFIK